jgi:type IV pilus assembly protein PilW
MKSTQDGMTVVELLVASSLSLLVALAASTTLGASKRSHSFQDDAQLVQETGRHAADLISRAIRHANHESWDLGASGPSDSAEISPGVQGVDAAGLKESTPGIEATLPNSVNGSDVIALRYAGSGDGPSGDGVVLNCAGFPVAAPENADADRGWSIFYVARDKGGEPELRCKYRGKSSWTSEAVARGVESFQVLYGIDIDGDEMPDRFMRAGEVDAMDSAIRLTGENAQSRAAELNRRTFWKRVAAVRFAILVRGTGSTPFEAGQTEFDLFGRDYSAGNRSVDAGTRVATADLPSDERYRYRKIFAATVAARVQRVGDS